METLTEKSNLDLFVNVVQKLSLARDITTVMRIVRTAARRLTNADGATFVLRERDMCFYADEDAISPLWKGSRFPIEQCVSGWAMLNKQAVFIKDIYDDDRVPADAYRPTFVKSLAMVPIRTIEPIGAIGNYWAHHHVPSEEEIKMLQSLADITAVTIENLSVYAELEQRVQDRTAELEAANKELEAFSYSVSHDLRAPLRFIDGYMQILIEEHGDKLGDSGMRTANKVMGSARQMNQLIDDLLAFFKMGKKELEKTVLSMKSMVDEIIAGEIIIEPGRHVEFRVQSLPDVKGDRVLLQQVWINLLSNAVKYSRKTEKAIIEIGFTKEESRIVFFVKDNGAGFDMKYVDKVFGVFQRLHSPKEYEGTGVGLSIVQRIIAKHQGAIWVEAAPNQGATFYFTLPV
jgi:hypothetical protein